MRKASKLEPDFYPVGLPPKIVAKLARVVGKYRRAGCEITVCVRDRSEPDHPQFMIHVVPANGKRDYAFFDKNERSLVKQVETFLNGVCGGILPVDSHVTTS